MSELKAFRVELDITRVVTVVIEAPNAMAAREKASNLEFDHEIAGEITQWAVKDVVEADR
ncbi:hypothetical protein ACXIUS_28295 [Bosea thiooxidans]